MINSSEIIDIGNFLSEKMKSNKIYSSEYIIYVNDNNELRKIDEDIFYRNSPNANSDEFSPSKYEIIIKFEYVDIIIRIKNEEEKEENSK